jgi:hypothetical protein
VGNRPDEQIEGAWDNRHRLPADFDAEDPTAAATPETSLAGGAFQSVPIGNDEIVLYALARRTGPARTASPSPRTCRSSRATATKRRSRSTTWCSTQNPGTAPYTLYRITFSNNPATWNTTGFVTRTPLVENVRSMQFKYYDLSGNQINSVFNLANTLDDIGGSEAAANVAQRTSIRRVEIRLEGLTREPDLSWTDSTDANAATKHLRKFELTADVTPATWASRGSRTSTPTSCRPRSRARPPWSRGTAAGSS